MMTRVAGIVRERRMKRGLPRVGRLAAFLLSGLIAGVAHAAPAVQFRVTLSQQASTGPMTGRLIVALGRSDKPEPRTAIGIYGPGSFGRDVSALKPGESVVIDAHSNGFPVPLSQLRAGTYYAQALLVRYDEVHRADGHALWVPIHPDRNTPFTDAQGNLYSEVRKVVLDPSKGFLVSLALTHVIPPPAPPKDSAWIRHVRIKSKLLSAFWGTPIYLGAAVLLPRGFDSHPHAHYPALYAMSNGDPPYDFSLKPATAAQRAALAARYNLKSGYEFYQSWISNGYPRFVVVSLYEASPYFLEAYAVDSVNDGPWGKAITTELIPYLEKKFRLIPQPYARVVEGASTGGWETLALQLKYPDFFGGAWVFNPDPISFKHWQLIDIYHDENMFAAQRTPELAVELPFMRTTEGMPTFTQRQLAALEAVLGSHGRSNYQLDIWQDTYGPMGPDGYPVLLFDKQSGKIDHQVAEYMRAHGYDLTEYARTHWTTLGPQLRGKLHFISGEMDNFYLNLGVYDFQSMLLQAAGPDYPVSFAFGRPEKGHGWHQVDFAQMIRQMGTHIEKYAPGGADTSQWNY
jgi:hypothetical protein